MFHFPRFAPPSLWIQLGVRRHYPPWVSPFGHRRIKAWLAAPRRFSQLPTSFFASCRLGIHRVPFVAWSCVSSGAPLSRAAPPSDPRRPGSSAAPVVNRNPYSTTTLLLRACAYSVVKERKSWWSRSGSNRRHPACKAGALPAELRPRYLKRVAWWAWVDLNYRPHAYQACALTS